jgi:alpha-tubulin suppressor-like RCC1 family protein
MVTAITAGADAACAPLGGGGVDCWGDNLYGELGNGTSSGPETCGEGNGETACSTTPVAVSGITNAIAITAGGHDARALLAGGGVDCWGDNYYGELGNATSSGPQTCYLTVCSTTPVAVIGFP